MRKLMTSYVFFNLLFITCAAYYGYIGNYEGAGIFILMIFVNVVGRRLEELQEEKFKLQMRLAHFELLQELTAKRDAHFRQEEIAKKLSEKQ